MRKYHWSRQEAIEHLHYNEHDPKDYEDMEEAQFESFLDSIMNEDEATATGSNNLFVSDIARRSQAMDQLKQLLAGGLQPGVDGINAVASLKGIIDSEQFTEKYLKGLSDNDDVGTAIKLYLKDIADGNIQEPFAPKAKEIAQQILASKELDIAPSTPVGGTDMPADAGAPPAPEGEVPPAPGGEVPPPAPPVAESMGKLKAKLIKVFEAGASLDTELDFGHRVMTLGEAMKACGVDMSPQQSGSVVDEMMDSISGFFNPEEKNFTIGGMRAKIRVLKDFKNGVYKNAKPQDVKTVIGMIDKLDPSAPVQKSHGGELDHIRHLAGAQQGNPQDVHVTIGKESQVMPENSIKNILSKLDSLGK